MPAIRLSGATPLVLRLEAPSFGLPYQALAEALQEDAEKQTIKMVLFNMPQNPTGAVYSRQELQQLVDLVIKTHPRCVFVSDEAYEGQAFAPHQHIRFSTLEHAAERTVVLGTASKLLSLTGWRVGWMISHNEKLIGACRALHAYATFCAPVPFQLGVAAALESDVIGDKTHTSDATLLMQDNAVMLQAALEAQGLQVLAPPKGGYFLVADVSTTSLNDTDFCKQLVKHARVGGVPLTVFYEGAVNPPNSLVRFAVCKTKATMVEVCKRLNECVSMTSEQFKA
jgi:aspartate/methionine/tyrosine aminotransferase